MINQPGLTPAAGELVGLVVGLLVVTEGVGEMGIEAKCNNKHKELKNIKILQTITKLKAVMKLIIVRAFTM